MERTYSLSPMQLGTVFETSDASQREAYVEQVICTLTMGLDLQAFERAWQRLIERHDALRTAFDATQSGEPVQRVYGTVSCPFVFYDWQLSGEEETERAFARFLDADRMKGFDLDRPPLFRFAIVQLSEGRRRFVWTHHHAILDGRARVYVLRELGELYKCERLGRKPTLGTPASFNEYIVWYSKQDWSGAERYWRDRLRDAVPSQPTTDGHSTEETIVGSRFGTVPLEGLPDQESLRRTAAMIGVTPNSIIQGVWAIVLARYRAQADVIFGTVRACRHIGPPEFHDVVGVRANTVPVRIHVDPQSSAIEYLKAIRAQHIALRDGESAAGWRIREWSTLAASETLFDTLVVLDNLPLSAALASDSEHAWQVNITRVVTVQGVWGRSNNDATG